MKKYFFVFILLFLFTPFASAREINLVAEIRHVFEINLSGESDLQYWNHYLRKNTLVPYDNQGKAQINIIINKLNWMGINFNEINIALAISDRENPKRLKGYYLLQAYNSNCILAFMERELFSTPYECKDIKINAEILVRAELVSNNEKIFTAEMSNQPMLINSKSESLSFPVFMENKKYFKVLLKGQTEYFPVNYHENIFLNNINPVFKLLNESDFKPRYWQIRRDAFHAKSETYNSK